LFQPISGLDASKPINLKAASIGFYSFAGGFFLVLKYKNEPNNTSLLAFVV